MNAPILYFYDKDGYFTESQQADRDPLDSCWLIPFNATETKPLKDKKGFARQFSEGGWHYIENHIGEIYYNTDTGEKIEITQYGALPDNLTDKVCPGEFYLWNKSKKSWVPDTEKQKQAQIEENQSIIKQCFALANEKITPLQDAVDCEIATEEEKASLLAWKKYRALLSRVDPESETIELPEQPQ